MNKKEGGIQRLSTLYPDLQNKFPVEVDDFAKFTDPNLSQITLINQYYTYMEAGNLSGAAEILGNNPSLKTAILNAERLNMMRDGLIAVQRYYLNDVQQYLVEIVKNKGEWNSGTKYTKYDVVFYPVAGGDQCFMATSTDIPIGTIPTDTSYWIPLTMRGEQGPSGIGMTPRGTWQASTSYSQYDVVSYDDQLWYALQANTGQTPYTGSSYWAKFFLIPNYIVSNQSQPQNQDTGSIWIQELE